MDAHSVPASILRDASLRDAPQDEVVFFGHLRHPGVRRRQDISTKHAENAAVRAILAPTYFVACAVK
jgi:hypothetical protein